MPCPPPRPFVRQPGVLSFEAWVERTRSYLAGMRSYLDRVLDASPLLAHGFARVPDRDSACLSFFRYVYATSANRFRSYVIVE